MDIKFVEHKGGEPVVDSRIVAKKLGIDHSDWLNNVIKTDKEGDKLFGCPREDKEGDTDFVWLTENQLFWYATLIEDNTPQVVDFKCQLVKSFFSAKAEVTSRLGKE
jgi:phage regulator Rha-like protein